MGESFCKKYILTLEILLHKNLHVLIGFAIAKVQANQRVSQWQQQPFSSCNTLFQAQIELNINIEQALCFAISTVGSYHNGSLTLVRFVRVIISLFKVAKSFNLKFKRKKGNISAWGKKADKVCKAMNIWNYLQLLNSLPALLVLRAKNRGKSGFSLSAEVSRGPPKHRAAGGHCASP